MVQLPGLSAIDNSNREAFFEGMQKLIGDSPHMVLCLDGIEHMTSSAIGTLVALYRDANESGGAIKLVGLKDKLKALFEMTHLDTLFEIFEDEPAALKSFDNV